MWFFIEHKNQGVSGKLPPRKIAPQLGLGFGLALGLGLGGDFGGNFPREQLSCIQSEVFVFNGKHFHSIPLLLNTNISY